MNKHPNFFSHSTATGRSAGRQKRLSFFLWVRDCAIKQLHKRGGLAICTAAIVPLTAHAADFTVDTLSDVDTDGNTLREAIVAANANGEADTISFAAGLSGILTLTQGELEITTDLAITGPEARITISGDDSSRIFRITNSTTSLSNLILTEGNSPEDFGGAIEMGNSQLTLTNCEVSNSSCLGNGGGIGGDSSGTLTLIDSVVSNNTAGRDGGGISTNNIALTLTNSQVSNNTSERLGGGIFAEISDDLVADLTLTNCMITDNSVTSSEDVVGGGIYATALRELAISNSVISGNTAISSTASRGVGGGLYCENIGSVTIQNSEISNNESSFFGGGLSTGFNGSVSVINATISENKSDIGGGFANYGGNLIALTNCTVIGNESSAAPGGGVYSNYANNVSISNCSITGNSATSATGGGGMDISSFSFSPTSLEIVNTICAFNNSTGGNNDLRLADTTLTLSSPNLFSDSTLPDPDSPSIVLSGGVQIIETDPANVFAVISEVNGITTGTLANNGGTVPTIALRTNGAAHNAGQTSALTADTQDLDNDGDITEPLPVDARGLARVSGGAVDLGAVELDPNSQFELTLVEVDQTGSAVLSFQLSRVLSAGDAWIVSRSTNLDNFEPIFAFNGTTVELEEQDNTSSLDAGENIFTIIDTSPPQPKAFYRLEIAPSPAQ